MMPRRFGRTSLPRVALVAALCAAGLPLGSSQAADSTWPAATPDIPCDAGSQPESIQGYVPPGDFTNGRAERGYYCNVRVRSFVGQVGGFRVERYVDSAGHVCAFY